MDEILGYFVFVNMEDGCIVSKFGNTLNNHLFTESGVRISSTEQGHPFVGEYVVTWLDGVRPVAHTQARLTILRKAQSTSQYTLNWRCEGVGTLLYHGEGMLHGGNLVGSYWSPSVQEMIDQENNL